MWMIDILGKRDEVAKHVKGLNPETARVMPRPSLGQMPKDPPLEVLEQRTAELKAATAVDDANWKVAIADFERVKAFVLAQVASYGPDAKVGVHARARENPPHSGSEELFVSISEHP